MAEYIEREALLATLAMADNPFTTFDNAWDMVEQAPAADVEPVVHGVGKSSLEKFCIMC